MSAYYNIHTHQGNEVADITTITSFSVDDPQINTGSYFSIGVHPWFINDPEQQLQKLKTYLNHPNLVAIGECGLDMLKGSDIEIQTKVFKSHIAFSEAFQKPLIIHCVKAYHLLLEIKKELNPKQPWIIHGFNGKPELALQLTKNNIAISLGTFWLKKQEHFRELLNNIPDKYLFFETDEAPVDDVKKIYALATTYKPEIKEIINCNVKKVFKI